MTAKKYKALDAIVTAALFLSFGFGGFHSARGTLAYYSAGGQNGFNDVWAILAAAAIGGAVYELVTAFLYRSTRMRLGEAVDEMRPRLKLFYIAANLCSGGLKTLYFAYPYLYVYGEMFFDFFFAAAFFTAFVVFSCKRYFPAERYPAVALNLGGSFLTFYGIVAAARLLTGVIS